MVSSAVQEWLQYRRAGRRKFKKKFYVALPWHSAVQTLPSREQCGDARVILGVLGLAGLEGLLV
jgi:hypothetical protein